MNEHVLPGGALNESVSFGPVEPLYCALLSHKELLSPLLDDLNFRLPREAHAPVQTPFKENESTAGLQSIENHAHKKIRHLWDVVETTTQTCRSNHADATCDSRTLQSTPSNISMHLFPGSEHKIIFRNVIPGNKEI
jgi:hypothetical protein